MELNRFTISSTNDEIIRVALKKKLENFHANDSELKIIEELGLHHGTVRIDVAVINGAMHGYEIKSDRDTLHRLPEQMNEYNAVFDQMTLVVGKSHLYDAINMIPDWWGVEVAKIAPDNLIVFNCIRETENNPDNPERRKISIARLLWRGEALEILEEMNEATGFRSKPRSAIYEKLASILDQKSLSKKVRETLLFARPDWRSDVSLASNGG